MNTKYLYNIYTTPAQHLRRWADVAEMLYKCFYCMVGQMIVSTEVMFLNSVITKSYKLLSSILKGTGPG